MKRFYLFILALTGFWAALNAQVIINEIRIDQSGADDDEFFELKNTAATPASLDGYSYLVIGDGTGGSGVIESVTDLTGSTIMANDLFVVAEATFTLGTADLTATLNFENSDNVTHLLVTGFTGASGDDLDTDDDGVLDVTPWTSVVDAISIIEEVGAGEFTYAASLGFSEVGPDGMFAPARIFRDASGNWQIGLFIDLTEDSPGEENDATAPVALTDFSGQLVKGEVVLHWNTAQEDGNDFFRVERAVGNGQFNTIGQVDGSGRHNVGQAYQFKDIAPATGENYYRLAQVDLDGTTTYYPAILIEVVRATTNVFPNPTSGTFTVNAKAGTTQVTLSDGFGRTVMSRAVTGQGPQQFDLSAMPVGLYFCTLQGKSETRTERIVIKR